MAYRFSSSEYRALSWATSSCGDGVVVDVVAVAVAVVGVVLLWVWVWGLVVDGDDDALEAELDAGPKGRARCSRVRVKGWFGRKASLGQRVRRRA